MNLENAELLNIRLSNSVRGWACPVRTTRASGLHQQSRWLRFSPSLSEISLEADIYRDGQLDMQSDKQAKVRLTWSREQGRIQGKPSLTSRVSLIFTAV